jgi:hypothetical protein
MPPTLVMLLAVFCSFATGHSSTQHATSLRQEVHCEGNTLTAQIFNGGVSHLDLSQSRSPDRGRWSATSTPPPHAPDSEGRSPSAGTSSARGAESLLGTTESEGASWAPSAGERVARRKRRARPQRAAGDNAAAWWQRFLELTCFRQAPKSHPMRERAPTHPHSTAPETALPSFASFP